jgi:Protein of unknown function (DUF2442)
MSNKIQSKEGFINIQPTIKKISFNVRGKISVELNDGRIILAPLSQLPSAKKLSVAERKHWQIIDGNMFTWTNCNEVYHLEQILGRYDDYQYN